MILSSSAHNEHQQMAILAARSIHVYVVYSEYIKWKMSETNIYAELHYPSLSEAIRLR